MSKSKNPKITVFSAEKYRKAKAITEVFKNFASYNIVRKYIDHALKNLETNKCLPDTFMLTKILSNEIQKASLDKLDYFQQELLRVILKSGLPLKGFHEEFPVGSEGLKYLFQVLKINELPSKENADILYDIYDPQGSKLVGKYTYPWGNCFY